MSTPAAKPAPLVLAIDTAAGLSLALARGSDILRRRATAVPQTTDVALLPTIQAWVHGAGVPDRIAVGTGPGSFTGTRVGIVAAKTLAWAWSVSLVGISSLEADAAAAGDPGAVVVATTELLRDELYGGVYRCRGAGAAAGVEVLVPAEPRRLSWVPAGWPAGARLVVTGPLAAVPAFMAALPGAEAHPDVFRACGLARLAPTAAPIDPMALEPQYLRPATRAGERGPGHGHLE